MLLLLLLSMHTGFDALCSELSHLYMGTVVVLDRNALWDGSASCR